MGECEKAIVCRSGHVINGYATSYPDSSAKFCPSCGAPGVSACEKCSEPIRGAGSALYEPVYTPASYCRGCGAAYPWTEARLKALRDLVAESGASEEERARLSESLPALAAEGPGTAVAVLRWKKFLAGSGKGLMSFARDLLVNVASEAVKGQLFGG